MELINIKKSILHMMHYSKSSHIGSCLSIVEILYVLYYKIMYVTPDDPNNINRDYFILSKAHASAALYATLAEKGFFPKDYLDSYYVDEGKLPGHLDKLIVPGIETSGGSLGHGLSIGCGISYGLKTDNKKNKVFVLIGDGECNEGSIWESIMFASTHNLSNLTAIIDYNNLQSFGRTNQVINQENLLKRIESFGWDTYEVNGHDIIELQNVLKVNSSIPKMVIAKTIKGHSISFMENKLGWHYKSPNDEEYLMAIKELEKE